MGLRVCHGRSQQRHALRRSAGRRVAPRAPRFRPPHSHRDRRCDADKSARGQPRHAATSPTARSISAHFHWRKSVPHPVTEYSTTRTLEEHSVKYLYIGKSAAIVHGFADTTQDADIFLDHSEDNKANVIRSLEHIGFKLTQQQKDEIKTGRGFVQFHNNGPFDVDLVFAPDGIEKFSDAWDRGRKIDGHQVCGMEDVIASKKAANRPKDRAVGELNSQAKAERSRQEGLHPLSHRPAGAR